MDERVDLSSLDPAAASAAGWERRVRETVARAVELRRQSPLLLQLLAWSRPALGLAAALAVVVWTAALFARSGARAGAEIPQEPAWALAGWAQGGELPSAGDVLALLGGDHEL
jgi:hypothetical protein